MGEGSLERCSPAAKLASVVLENCGPLSASEVAEQAYLCPERAREGLAELADRGLAEPVCGVCADREEVYALTVERPPDPSP